MSIVNMLKSFAAAAVAAPLRADARGGSCVCGESRQPLAKQAIRGACPQIFALTKDGKRRIECGPVCFALFGRFDDERGAAYLQWFTKGLR